MIRTRGLTHAAIALFLSLQSLSAQDTVQVTTGARIRVTEGPGVLMHTGSYRALTDTALVLSSGASVYSIPLGRITEVELSRGRKPSVAGGIVGLLLGGAAGGVLACAANRDDYGVFCAGQDDSKLIIGAALGGAAGAALGALLFRREAWKAVELGSPPLGSSTGDE
jgi:hypothetical protein